MVVTACIALTGCGTGGYAGNGITSLSSSTVVIDAGQSFQITAELSGDAPVSWKMAGGACTGSACGSLSDATGGTVTYTAPSGITTQLKVTLTAAMSGTADASVASITVNPDPVISGTPPSGTVGKPYSTILNAAGGTAPLSWNMVGTLPDGLTFDAKTGAISGTPTASGSFSFLAQTLDSSDVPYTVKAGETIAISTSVAPLEFISGNPPAGTVGAAYSTLLSASGGTSPYSFSVTSGSLPEGLTLTAATGVIAGTPIASGTSDFTAEVEDASGTKVSASFSITINSAGSGQVLALSLLPGATVGIPYHATIGVTGGTAPYTCLQTGGTLPGGLTLSASCVVSGTPTNAGTSVFNVKATDSSSPALEVTGPESIAVSAPSALSLTSPPNATVGTFYSGIIGVGNGTAPYNCVIVSGTLPAGLTPGSACLITGTPTAAGTSNLIVTATDSSSPIKTITGPVSLTVIPSALTLTLSTLPEAEVGVPYSASIVVSGGTAPYACLQTGGTLPAGLTLSAGCWVSGTPTAAGTSILQVKATDSSNPVETTAGPESITVASAGSLIISSPPSATVGTPYSGIIGVSDGTSPYSCVITGGIMPAGLSLGAGCLVTGTPTTAGVSIVTVKATDSSSPAKTMTGPVTLAVLPAPLSLTLATLPGGTVGVAYTATIGVSGGTAPYACSQVGGNLPAGLTLSASCVVSGTPSASGTATLVVRATDSSSPVETTTGPESITVSPAPLSLALATLPGATVGVAYSATIGVAGGTSPYACSQVGGTLPAGLVLSASCVVSGTPTTAGASIAQVKATDSSNPVETTTGPESITVSPAPLSLTLATLPGATVGVAYSATIGVTGGTAPYACIQAGGTLPAGLTLSASCVVSGTPTTAGNSTVQVKATDSTSPVETTTGPENITVSPAPLSLTLATLPGATVGVPYNVTVGVSGGTAPYACSQAGGALPAGLALSAGCVVSGTPTAAGTSTVQVKATDSSNPVETTTGPESITVSPAPLSLTLATLPGATVGVPYNVTVGVSGGTAPYACSQAGGTLPAGLTLSASCVVSGTPTTAGTSIAQVKATDSGNPVETTTGPESITVSPAPLSLPTPTLPGATVGIFYNVTIGVSGGTPPYACSQVGGTLPAGLTLSASCVLSGTPTSAGTSTVQVKVTDSSTIIETTTGPESVTVSPAPLSLVSGTLPGATVGVFYNATIGISGGTAPYACRQLGGTLPAGLTLSATCVVSGTPTTTGTSTLQVKATDSSSPVESITGPESITVSAAPLSLTSGTLPGATVGVVYSATIGVSGGTAPYACSQVGGTLPAGLTLSASCVVSGTPTTVGTSTLQVKATDSGTPVQTTTGPESITVSPAPLYLTVSNLPNATVGTPYTATIGVAGGTPPYSCSIVAGTLPAGLTLGAACVISGTPTVAATVTLTIKATDASNPVETTSGPVGLTVLAAPPTLTLTPPPNATVNVPYSGTIGVTGGNSPYTCILTAGTLPAGLTLSASCVISGTPTTAGSTPITIKVTDSSTPAATTTGPITITVLPPTATLTLSSPPNPTVSVPYTGTIGVTGGTPPYNCTLVSGTLPAGLSLGAACALSGTPTVVGTSTVTIHATDSATPTPDTVTGPVSITVSPIPTLSLNGSLPNATQGVPYTQTLVATGGLKPYTYSLTAGALPAGLSLSSAGTISGTPTAVGASSFTVTVTDTESTPQTASLPLVLLVVYPTTATDSELTGPYAFLFQGYDDVLAGVLAYQTATVGSLTADGNGVISNGELDSNHQSSNPSGNTVSSQQFLGTYTLATDNLGYMTITPLNADGTTGTTSTYAIAAKAPLAPATVVTEVDMIEFDDSGLQGTRGSGTMLAQQPTSFSAGLQGSYAFGLSGDTPCLPSCVTGIIAGPAASVGQFTTGGTRLLTAGTSDANIATTNYADTLLTGSYGVADGNGRLDLTMDTAGTPAGIYPTDYAVYLVNANQAFMMSTDKHSTYLLLAGTAQLQTQTTFSNASMNGAFVGYENAQADPGLLGVSLGNTLNLSTATIFRATGNGAGTCDFTNVDAAGLTALVDGLTGLGSGATIQNALLGTYQSTGTSTCTVAANGRGVLHYPAPNSLLADLLALLGLSTAPPAPREFYLISPDSGYFLETSYAGLGRFEPQTGTPSTLASLDGTYIYASQPAASLVSINTSGILVANGAGSATTTADLNVGLGTVNVLETDVTSTSTYHLTDAAAGRFMLGATIVVYQIAPGRFVLVDTNALTTSPSISLLY